MTDKRSILKAEEDSYLALIAAGIIKKNGFAANIVHPGECFSVRITLQLFRHKKLNVKGI